MLHPRRFPLLSVLLLAAYVAASTFGGLFHDHAGHGHHEADSGCQHGRAEHRCPGQPADEDDAHQVAGVSQEAPDDDPLHDDDCEVCRFVAQKVVAVETASLERLCQLSVDLTTVDVSQPTAKVTRTTHSRAPPLA
jgi:hypothetical protein